MAEEGSYSLRILRLNLTTGKVSEERIDGETTRKYIGGTGLATKYLWEEVPAGVEWSDPKQDNVFHRTPGGNQSVGLGHVLRDHQGSLHEYGRHLPGKRVLRRLHEVQRDRRHHRRGGREDVDPHPHP